MKKIFEYVVAAALGLVLALLLKTFVLQGYVVNGESMLPTLQNRDFLFGEKISYKVSGFQYGDIVVIGLDDTYQRKHIIKRVIGLEGDKIEVKDGYVYRNGKKLSEKFIREPGKIAEDFNQITVPKDHIFVMGDNRNNSSDSRVFGAFSYDEVNAKIFVEVRNQLKFY